FFFFSSRRRHTRCLSDWSSDVCSSDLEVETCFPNTVIEGPAITRELKSFYESVEQNLAKGLTIPGNEGEWYGPATAAIAHRVLRSEERRVGKECRARGGRDE